MSTGELLWDKTIQVSPDPEFHVYCREVFIDNKDQIYVCGQVSEIINGVGTNKNYGFLIKYTAEGNLIWQTQTDPEYSVYYERVRSDGETEQTVVFGRYDEYDINDNYVGTYGILTKYSKNGDVVWSCLLYTSDAADE